MASTEWFSLLFVSFDSVDGAPLYAECFSLLFVSVLDCLLCLIDLITLVSIFSFVNNLFSL